MPIAHLTARRSPDAPGVDAHERDGAQGENMGAGDCASTVGLRTVKPPTVPGHAEIRGETAGEVEVIVRERPVHVSALFGFRTNETPHRCPARLRATCRNRCPLSTCVVLGMTGLARTVLIAAIEVHLLQVAPGVNTTDRTRALRARHIYRNFCGAGTSGWSTPHGCWCAPDGSPGSLPLARLSSDSHRVVFTL
jgi:hypothetical protein